jgi:hypothetical protein
MGGSNVQLPQLDIRDVSILDALPSFTKWSTVLTIGCGAGRLEMVGLAKIEGIRTIATDMHMHASWPISRVYMDESTVAFMHGVDILDTSRLPEPTDIVICSEVLEHLPLWKHAFQNLLYLARVRLIITVPWKESFDVPGDPPIGHCNYWGSQLPITEFEHLAAPYHTSISLIRTKPKDVQMKQYCYLIVVDKEQSWNNPLEYLG